MPSRVRERPPRHARTRRRQSARDRSPGSGTAPAGRRRGTRATTTPPAAERHGPAAARRARRQSPSRRERQHREVRRRPTRRSTAPSAAGTTARRARRCRTPSAPAAEPPRRAASRMNRERLAIVDRLELLGRQRPGAARAARRSARFMLGVRRQVALAAGQRVVAGPERDAALGRDQHEAPVHARVPGGPGRDDQARRRRAPRRPATRAANQQPQRGERQEEQHGRPRQGGEPGTAPPASPRPTEARGCAAANARSSSTRRAGEREHAVEASRSRRRPASTRAADRRRPASAAATRRAAGRPMRPAHHATSQTRRSPQPISACVTFTSAGDRGRAVRSAAIALPGTRHGPRAARKQRVERRAAEVLARRGRDAGDSGRTKPRPRARLRASSRYSCSSSVSGLSTQ